MILSLCDRCALVGYPVFIVLGIFGLILGLYDRLAWYHSNVHAEIIGYGSIRGGIKMLCGHPGMLLFRIDNATLQII